MLPTRIVELLHPYLSNAPRSSQSSDDNPAALSLTELNDISTYIDILLRWNSRINLTAIRDPEEIVTRHFGESVFVARQLFPTGAHAGTAALIRSAEQSPAPRVADIGSGAGFPGVPIKLWAPNIALTLIESNHKKATFLREVARSLTLTNVNILNVRAEEVAQRFDLVTLRAVERFADTLPDAARLLAPAARLALLITAPQIKTARSILQNVGWDTPLPIPGSKSRVLLVGRVEPGK
ncbi:MAG TPA: 16S rRNA (guanine(527)-N(7))-methyltransferase RsmG [Candidatus Acidoferrales bacterium]|nr:16S rRNA (guanine(527)-N(7))-methyltransferase RsmG [Candidatus Acidoferrales bacterium]